MIQDLSNLFSGRMAALDAALVIRDNKDAFEPVSQLLERDRLSAVLDVFAGNYDAWEDRAVASQWSKIYFSHLLIPTVAAAIAYDWRFPLMLSETGIVLAADGRVEAFQLMNSGCRENSEDSRQRFAFLIEAHITAVVHAVSSVSGLSKKVLWSNVGNIFENVVRHCEASLGATHFGVADGYQYIAIRRFADESPNPLFAPVRYLNEKKQKTRKRRICCIRYLIPSLPYCKTCPLSEACRAKRIAKAGTREITQ